jgi:hypothetical protein
MKQWSEQIVDNKDEKMRIGKIFSKKTLSKKTCFILKNCNPIGGQYANTSVYINRIIDRSGHYWHFGGDCCNEFFTGAHQGQNLTEVLLEKRYSEESK